MRTNHTGARRLAALCALAALALPRAALTETVDDTFLITTSVKPNVILIFDNSTTMNQIEWHPAFNPTTAPTCAGIDPNTEYVATGNNETYCGNTRRMYKVTGGGVPDTLWNGKYLAWYYSLNTGVPTENAILSQIASSTVTVAGCNSAGAGTRFTAQFRRTRADAMRQVFFDVLCLSEPKGLRFGLGLFRLAADSGSPKVDPNGGYVAAAVDDNTPAHAADLEAHVGNTKVNDVGTPLTEAVFQLYTYLMPRVDANIPFGQDGTTRFPKYVYNKSGDDSSSAGGRLGDPVQQSCQKNYMILVTSGLATRDDFDTDPATTSQGFANFTALVGDYYSEGDTEVPGSADERTLYLDDLTKYMHENDLRPDFADDQTIDFYTIGFGTTAADNAYLRRVSETVGGGLHFTVQDGDALSQALVDALNDIVEKSRSFTAATVPSARTADGGDFYNSFFLPSDRTAFWEGHLRAWHFTAAGEIVDSGNHCALVDPDGGSECNDGPFQVVCQTGQTWPACVNPFWDAGDATRLALDPGTSNSDTNARQLYASKLLSGTPTLVDFDMALTRTDLKLQTFTVAGVAGTPADPSPNSDLYTSRGSQALNADGLADEVIAFGRGCFFGTGVTGANIQPAPDGQKPCAERGWLIGDIFHSDPIVVRNPADRELGPSYDAFRATYGTRDRVIYTGTNGGYLEGFHAGDWVSSPSPGKYNEGTGVELFGFMPWEPRTKIKNQPIDSPSNRTHYVDGAPQVADAWLYSSATSPTKVEADWHTVLAGGLREGGRQYYALDVTNPSKLTGVGKPAYPELLWEFPTEADFNSGTGDYQHMGETWGQAIMTRVRLQVGCNPMTTCLDNSGEGFERWVAIVTGGYDAASDPNPTVVDPSAAYNASSTKGRAIYMLDLKTGEVIAQQKVGTPGAPPAINTGTVQNQMQYSILSTPAVIDIDADGFADVVYVGDLGGNLFKWVIHEIGEDRVNDSSGVRTQPAWKFQHIFQAPTFTGAPGSTKYYKNIFQPPSAAYVNNTLWIGFGTGQRAAIGFTDRLTDGDDPADATADDEDHTGEENRFYAITDPDPLATAVSAPLVLTEAAYTGSPGLTDITTVGTAVTSPRGYYFKSLNAEKFVTTTVIFAGKVITASFTPSQIQPGSPGWDPCSQRGSGKLYIFDLKTGQGVFEDGAGGEQRFQDIGSGLPTDPKISIGVGGDDNKIVLQQSGTEVKIIDAEDISYGRGIIYWREQK